MTAPEWTKLLTKFLPSGPGPSWHVTLNAPYGRVALGSRASIQTVGNTMHVTREVLFKDNGGEWGATLPRWLPDLTAEQTDNAESLARALRPHRLAPERCIVCRRPLNDEAALAAQIGPECLRRMRKPAPKKTRALAQHERRAA